MGLVAKRNDVFEGLAAHAAVEALLSIDGRAAEWIQIESVSHKYFDVLQLNAVRGRAFLPGETRRPDDAPFVVVAPSRLAVAVRRGSGCHRTGRAPWAGEHEARTGTLTAGWEWFKRWRTIAGEGWPSRACRNSGCCSKASAIRHRLLALVRDFIVFEDDGSGALVKNMAEYHQFHRRVDRRRRDAARGSVAAGRGGR